MTTQSSDPITYAIPTPSYTNKVWAGIAILLAGLGLVVLGGCFLIGVMLLSTNSFNSVTAPVVLTRSDLILIFVLYALAFISFISAAMVMLAGVRALLGVLKN